MRGRIGGKGLQGGCLESPAVWGAGLALRRAGETASGAEAEPRGEKGRMGSRAVRGWLQVGGAVWCERRVRGLQPPTAAACGPFAAQRNTPVILRRDKRLGQGCPGPGN